MTKQQRIRWEMRAALRANAAASTARHDDFQIIRNRYNLSTLGCNMQHAQAIFVCASS